MGLSDGTFGVLLALLPFPLGGCPVCGSWLGDAHPFIIGFVPYKPNFKRRAAGQREPADALGRVREEVTCSLRTSLPPALPGEHEWGAAEAAAAAGACVNPHRRVLQCPHYCLLPTKAFYHDLHQQVKAHRIKPAAGESGPESTRGGHSQRRGCPLLPKKMDCKGSRERWLLQGDHGKGWHSERVTREEREDRGPGAWEGEFQAVGTTWWLRMDISRSSRHLG